MKDDLRRDCQERRCATELHGGDYRPISTPHRSGIKMKKKSRVISIIIMAVYLEVVFHTSAADREGAVRPRTESSSHYGRLIENSDATAAGGRLVK